MVTMGGVDRFYKRTGTVNHKMSLDEIRRAFSEQGELREAIAAWRAHRVDLIQQKRGPIPVSDDAVMLFHVIPADAFTPGAFTEAWRAPESESKDVYVFRRKLLPAIQRRRVSVPLKPRSRWRPQKPDGYWR